jgi:hypothetical protein
MSRFSATSREVVGQVFHLPDKEFRSVHLTPFPEEPDFLFLALGSFWKRSL